MITLLGTSEPTLRISRTSSWASFRPNLPAAFTHAPAALAVTTLAGTIVTANTALAALLGRNPAALVGTTFLEVTHPDDVAALHSGIRQNSAAPQCGGVQIGQGERRLRLDDGRVIWVSLSAARLPGADERSAHLVVHVDDVTDRRRREADLAHRALHDPLTGLGNRALLIDRLAAALAQLDRHHRPSHLYYLDLDGFKPVNDRFGHAAGDAVLVQFAERISRLLRVGDTAARLGGDEFAVLCGDATPGVADTIAARLRDAAARTFVIEGTALTLSASVGDCPIRRGATPSNLLREVDQRMYAAKRRIKRNQILKPTRSPLQVADKKADPILEQNDEAAEPNRPAEPTFIDLMGDFGLTTAPLSRRRLIRREGRRNDHRRNDETRAERARPPSRLSRLKVEVDAESDESDTALLDRDNSTVKARRSGLEPPRATRKQETRGGEANAFE